MPRFAPTRPLVSFGTLILVAMLVTCSGDDGGPSGPGGGNASSLTGNFVDSAVQGLAYVSGSKSGTTDAAGTFSFVRNQDVVFSVGDIGLGSGDPAAVMSPLGLVLGAFSVTDHTVTNIARFLQTIDDDGNPDNGIVITGAVRTAAAGQSINFAQSISAFGSDTEVLNVISVLTEATSAGERALVGSAVAQTHLSGALRAAYQGTYGGKFCEDTTGGGQVEAGTWSMTVAANGSVTIAFTGSGSYPDFDGSGTMLPTGDVTIPGPGPQIYAGFDPDFGGRWYYGEFSGSFSESADCTD